MLNDSMIVIHEISNPILPVFSSGRKLMAGRQSTPHDICVFGKGPTKRFLEYGALAVGDAIEYANELKRAVAELKFLAEKNIRCRKDRLKRHKVEDGTAEGSGIKTEAEDHDLDQPIYGSSLRSSWIHRKSKSTDRVDLRIIDDEVTVKLVLQKKINCPLFLSKVLDELKLGPQHVSGCLIGDYYSFVFSFKVKNPDGSTVYAHDIGDMLIEVVDKRYAAVPPACSY